MNHFVVHLKITQHCKLTMCVLSCFSHAQLFATSWSVVCQASLSTDSPVKNTGVDCHGLFQRIILTQGWNPLLLFPALAGGFLTLAPSGY